MFNGMPSTDARFDLSKFNTPGTDRVVFNLTFQRHGSDSTAGQGENRPRRAMGSTIQCRAIARYGVGSIWL
jgi:hypothetical protein